MENESKNYIEFKIYLRIHEITRYTVVVVSFSNLIHVRQTTNSQTNEVLRSKRPSNNRNAIIVVRTSYET